MKNLFQWGSFTLHSGEAASFKIDCDALARADWECLAELMAARVGAFRTVVGIPTGGQMLEELLSSRSTNDWRDPVLIVDDVYTTGKSMKEAHDSMLEGSNIVGMVVFARRPVRELWVTALFTMGPEPRRG